MREFDHFQSLVFHFSLHLHITEVIVPLIPEDLASLLEL
jgi:hypothetical protein